MWRWVRAGMVAAAFAAGFGVAATLLAADQCMHCGCCSQLRKCCRVVAEKSEITESCWDVKCEEFCVPGPSKRCGVVQRRDECGTWCETIWKPGCAQIRTRQVPVRKEVQREVTTYRWEVVTVCATCCRGCASVQELSGNQKLALAMGRALTGQEPTEVPAPVGPVVRPVDTSGVGRRPTTAP